MSRPPVPFPRATYRIQLNKSFTFSDAAALAAYWAELGISHLYASPLFKAAEGSTHGYDVTNPNEVNPELGGRKGLEQLHAQLAACGIGLILDFVPNHMGIHDSNAWWDDVLENGIHSPFAHYFDIEWNPRNDALRKRVLVPLLPEPYGAVLEKGGLQLRCGPGGFQVALGKNRFPIRPGSWPRILEPLAGSLPEGHPSRARLARLLGDLAQLPRREAEQSGDMREHRRRRIQELKSLLETCLAEPGMARRLEDVLALFNGKAGEPASFDALHGLLEEQHYRLAYWKVGAHEVNYRRFFAIDTLAGLRMEDPEVFGACHRLLEELFRSGTAAGVRIDHVDGLWDPQGYLERLRELLKDAPASRIWVEKILTDGEELPPGWPVEGTTGYEFTALLADLFLEPEKEEAWTRAFRHFTGIRAGAEEIAYQSKGLILEEMFSHSVADLAAELYRLIRDDRHWRDLTEHDLGRALAQTMACLSVYRTYFRPGQPMSEDDRERILRAIREARQRRHRVDPEAFRFLQEVLTGGHRPPAESGDFDHWVCKVQQITGAVMAKSMEDTFFYRYVRMFAANEVGGDPGRFGRPAAAFHQANRRRGERAPLSLLATSTHDSKVSEDVRARLFGLAGEPVLWAAHLARWRECNRRFKTFIRGREAPDAAEEYLLYQVLLGAWPLEPGGAGGAFLQRIQGYMRKAVSEAKVNTDPDSGWNEACDAFVAAILDRSRASPFLESFLPFAGRIAKLGMLYSLAQTLLKMAAPGIPDFYQGNEAWDFSLVDPDNRRPVDFAARQRILASLPERSPEELLHNWRDGGIKMHLIRSVLRFRAAHGRLFSEGSYHIIEATGPEAGRIVAFIRRTEERECLAAVPKRFTPEAGPVWTGTHLPLSGGPWNDLLAGGTVKHGPGGLPAAGLFRHFPVAFIERKRWQEAA
jgi:(1->4)-alpha-D-glucan 1-alpha-D-glucosylmutase